MKNSKAFLFIVLTIFLVAGNVFIALQYVAAQQELRQAQRALTAQKINERTLAFTRLFIDQVLQSDTEVEFEARLQLENAVRAIGDQAILEQWQRFTTSATEAEAQREVRNLLSLLIQKVEM